MVVNIQVLRCFAALAVVLHHLQNMQGLYFGMPHLTLAGIAGVDVFFGISGFIVGYTNRAQARTTGEFWTDRVVRIAPLYWAATALAVVMFFGGLRPAGIEAIDSGDIVAALFFIPDVRADGFPYPVLDVGWTLIYEMFFYILFGLTFFLRSQVKSLLVLTGLFMTGWVISSSTSSLPHAAQYLMQPITLEFAAGGLLALVFASDFRLAKSTGRWLGGALIAGGVIAILVASQATSYDLNTDMTPRVLLLGVPAVAIVAGALLLEQSGLAWKSPMLLLLGAASYAIYLFHLFPLQIVLKAASAVLGDAGPVLAMTASLAALITVIVSGVMIHLWFEKPLTRLIKTLLGRRGAAQTTGRQAGMEQAAPPAE